MVDKFVTTLTKLNSENYLVWSFKLKLFLTKEGCWDVIEDPLPLLDQRNAEWKKKYSQAYANIGLLIEDNHLSHIKYAKTAEDAWDILKKYHQQSTLSNKVYLIRKICRIQLSADGNMESHMSQMMDYIEKLKGIGEELFNYKWIIAFLLNSLPVEYDTLITALETRKDDELTLDLVKSKLIDEWSRKRNNLDNKEIAMKVTTSTSSEYKATASNCEFCHKYGHFKKDCWKFKKFVKRPNVNNYIRNQANCTFAEDEDKEWIFFSKQDRDEFSWYIDSGATCHIANNKEFFTEFSSSIRENVFVANGIKLQSLGRGCGYIDILKSNGNVEKRKIADVLFVPDLKANLLSVRQSVLNGFELLFKKNICSIQRNMEEVAIADVIGNLFKLRQYNNVISLLKNEIQDCILLWHKKLGHRDIGL